MHSPSLPRPGIDLFRAGPDTYTPRFDQGARRANGSNWRHDGVREGRRRHSRTGTVPYPLGVFVGASPYYYWPPAAAPAPQPPVPASTDEPEGFLRLLITPRHAGVWVDGVYEGTVDDFGGSSERPLPAGIHDVRVEADGFEPVEFDVRVPARDTITLRRDLERRQPAPALPPPQAPAPRSSLETPPAKPKTIYVIPRCYLGDSRPQQNQLPAGCSLADLRTLN